jgi:hypothetical protein
MTTLQGSLHVTDRPVASTPLHTRPLSTSMGISLLPIWTSRKTGLTPASHCKLHTPGITHRLLSNRQHCMHAPRATLDARHDFFWGVVGWA